MADSSQAETPDGYDEMLLEAMEGHEMGTQASEGDSVVEEVEASEPEHPSGVVLEEWMKAIITTEVAPEVKEVSKTFNIPVHPRDLHVTNHVLQSRLLAAR